MPNGAAEGHYLRKRIRNVILGGVNNQLVNIQNNLLATFRGNIDVGEADR